jgi:hypothetical protein
MLNAGDLEAALALMDRVDEGDAAAKAALGEMRERLAKEARHEGPAKVYPPITAPDFHARLAGMREFYASPDPAGTATAGSRGVRPLLRHQRLVKAFMQPGTGYNGVLIVHDTGAGKSCTAVAIAEMYRRATARPALVIAPAAVREQFLAEVADHRNARFEAGRWVLPPTCAGPSMQAVASGVPGRDRKTMRARVRGAVDARYEVKGYGAFANAYAAAEARGDAHDVFSDRVVIVDEAHNLRNDRAAKEAAECLARLVARCTGVKLVLMTATPMFDRANEVVYLLNLLRVNDGRPPLQTATVFAGDGSLVQRSDSTPELGEACRGYVSFSRGGKRSELPITLPPSVAPGAGGAAWPDKTHDGHAAVAPEGVYELCPSVARQGSAMATLLTDACSTKIAEIVSNVAFPGGERAADRGFRRCFTGTASAGGMSYRPDRLGFFRGDSLADNAPKVARVVDLLRTCTGVAFVHSVFLWAGVMPMAVALEEAGFRRVHGPQLLTKPNEAPNGRTYCIVTATPSISTAAANSAALKAARGPGNVNGEAVSVVLGTSSVVEGTDLRYVREVHLMEPWWNAGRSEQVVGRAVRHGSHAALPEEERNVTVYHHVCELPGGREGVDHVVVRRAMAKRATVAAALSVLREEAVDCAWNREEYVDRVEDGETVRLKNAQGVSFDWQTGDRDGSRACMYGECPGKEGVLCADGTLMSKLKRVATTDDVEAAHARLEAALADGSALDEAQAQAATGLPDDVLQSALDELAGDRWTLVVGEQAGTIVRAEDGVVAFVPERGARQTETVEWP